MAHKNTFLTAILGLSMIAPLGASAQSVPLRPETFAGTVVARDLTGLSYEARGCIVSVSETAKKQGVALAGQPLVELDAKLAELAVKTARARVIDLEAAVDERDLSISAARASLERRAQEVAFVTKEFTRNDTMFRRGLINETAMETVERRMMDANFAEDQAEEALTSAMSAKVRAEIALEIGVLELETRELDLDALVLTAPYDGVLLGFDPNVGDCVQDGALAGQIYAPEKKAVEIFVLIDQLVSEDPITIGAPVDVTRINGEICAGSVTWIDTEANLENQYVKSTIEVEEGCAQSLFLNEAVEVEIAADAS